MIYEVIFTKSAKKAVFEIPKSYSTKIIETIDQLAFEPRPLGCKKLKGYNNIYRIRVGKYRIIYSINDSIVTVKIMRIGHRKNIYD